MTRTKNDLLHGAVDGDTPPHERGQKGGTPGPSQDAETIPGTRMRVDWQDMISAHNLELPRLPDDHAESLRLGNGDIGMAVYAIPESLVLFVGKNDLLDYRTKPLAHFPEATAISNAKTPMPTTKPAGWIRLRNATPRNPDTAARLDIWNAEVSTQPTDTQTPELRAFVAKNRHLIAAEYHAPTEEGFAIELARHRDTTGVIDTAPEFGANGREIWVRYLFPPDPDTYPEGFEYVMFGRAIGGQVLKAEVVAAAPKPQYLSAPEDYEYVPLEQIDEGVDAAPQSPHLDEDVEGVARLACSRRRQSRSCWRCTQPATRPLPCRRLEPQWRKPNGPDCRN